MFSFRFRNIIAICIFVWVFMATFGTCHAVKSQLDFKQWPKDFYGLHKQISQRYAFTQWKGIDWHTLGEKFSKDVARAAFQGDAAAYYTALRGYLFLIPDGHVMFGPYPLAGDDKGYRSAKELHVALLKANIGGGYGLGVTHLDDGQIIVYYLSPGGPAERAGILLGAKVNQWNGKPVEKVITQVSTLWRDTHNGLATLEHKRLEQERLLTRAPVGHQATIMFQNPSENEPKIQTLTAAWDDYDTLNHGNFAAKASLDPAVEFRILPSGHGYIKVTQEPNPPEYDVVLKSFGEAITNFVNHQVSGVIVDLRGNQGGHDQLAADLAGFFYKEKTFYETFTQYNLETEKFEPGGVVYINPQEPYYGGPVTALVNPGTISSGEGIAMAIQKSPQGQVLGFHGTNGSFGMVLEENGSANPFWIDNLPFLAIIPVGQSLDQNSVVQLDSRNGIGGVSPGIRVPRTADNVIRFAKGEDVELEAAIWPAGVKLQTILNNNVNDEGVPGAVMAVETPEGTWVGAAGKADLTTGQPMTANTQVRIASITKVFTAALIMKLMEEEHLELNDTVDNWLPGALPCYGDQITVRMLLNHTSGIPDHENTQEWHNRLLSDPTTTWTSEDVLDIVRLHKDEFVQPGTAYAYCNTGYYLLGMIAEAATKDTVTNVINRTLFHPLNMRRTALTRDGMKSDPYAHDYVWGSDELLDTSGWNMSWDWTAGSGVTIASDMLRWTRGFFGGEVVSRATLNQMMTAILPSTDYGFGLDVSAGWAGFFGEKTISHSGANAGVYTLWFYFPESNRTIFVALNRMDFSDPPVVDSGEIMMKILSGVRDICWNQ
ncbi:MAG: serine hydrolase [Deltaproteobacteria bacterium]|nr:serine hydrolase [Deltaproteobacteria bacterium]